MIRPGIILWGLALGAAAAGPAGDPLAGRSRLYTPPDPSSPGGITGRVGRPAAPIEQVLAIPADAPERVYAGRVEGADRQAFRFEGLPMRRYDLVIIYPDAFYEGLQLHRGPGTLTGADRTGIEAGIRQSEPYFPHKVVHRLEGATGRGGTARAICTYYQPGPSALLFNSHQGGYTRNDPRRTFKLVLLRQVGPGWQIERSRDLYPAWVTPDTLRPRHAYRSQLARIRVADSVKDLGPIDLAP